MRSRRGFSTRGSRARERAGRALTVGCYERTNSLEDSAASQLGQKRRARARAHTQRGVRAHSPCVRISVFVFLSLALSRSRALRLPRDRENSPPVALCPPVDRADGGSWVAVDPTRCTYSCARAIHTAATVFYTVNFNHSTESDFFFFFFLVLFVCTRFFSTSKALRFFLWNCVKW